MEHTGIDRIIPISITDIQKLGGVGSITYQYFEMIHRNGPYRLMITLTFGKVDGPAVRLLKTNRFIHRMNQLLYCRDYQKITVGLKGYAFFEDHKSDELYGLPHVHILLKSDERLDRHTFEVHRQIFFKAIRKTKIEQKQAFNFNCVSIVEVRDNGAITYCIGDVDDWCTDRIKPISIYGLSDGLDHISRNNISRDVSVRKRSVTKMFHGTIRDLKMAVELLEISGQWQKEGSRYTFITDNSAMNWWPSTKTIQFVGDDLAMAMLEQSLVLTSTPKYSVSHLVQTLLD